MKFKQILVLFLVIFCTQFQLSAQTLIKAKGGWLEELYPWNEGYLGVTHNWYYLIAPKKRTFKYYNKSGILLWEAPIDPYNFNNTIVLSEDSEYAYLVNGSFENTADLEKKSSTTFVTLYRVDKQGKVKKKAIRFKDQLEFLKGDKGNLEIQYMDTYSDGLVFVVSDPVEIGKSYLLTISHEFEVKYVKMGFEWNEKDWLDNKISKLNFSAHDGQLSVIQVNNIGSEFKFLIETFDLNTLENVEQVENTLNLEGYLFGSNLSKEALWLYSTNQVAYYHSYFTANASVTEYKLGSLFNYQFSEGQLFAIGTTYLNSESIKRKNPKGFAYFPLSLSTNSQVSEIKEVTFSSNSEDNKVMQYSMVLGQNPAYVYNVRGGGFFGARINDTPKQLEKATTVEKAMAQILGYDKEESAQKVHYLFRTKNNFFTLRTTKQSPLGGYRKVWIERSDL